MFDVSVLVAGVKMVDDHEFDGCARQSSVTGLLLHLLLVDFDEVKHSGEFDVG